MPGKNNQLKPDYDLIIIGAGPAGYVLALECGRRGMKTALVDNRQRPGGTCLNVGCIPSKALLESSELYYRLKNEAGTHGIIIPSGAQVLNLERMMERKTQVIDRLCTGISGLLKARNVTHIEAAGTVCGTGRVHIDAVDKEKTEITALKIVLATGSMPSELPFLPFDGEIVIDSTDALSFKKVPESLAVIGAGAVGLEIGSIWNRLGSKVTVIEAMDRIIPGSDAQASRSLETALKKQGMSILTSSTVKKSERHKSGITLNLEKGSRTSTLIAEKVLVAVGRRANLKSGLAEGIQPELTADGRFIQVDNDFKTSIPNLYAIGDLVGNPMLAHKAEEEAAILAALLAGEDRPPWGGPVPGIVYTEPEAAWAGESEESLKASNTPYIKGHFPYAANGRALAAAASEGFIKYLSSPGDRRLLGVVIVGRAASELIAEAVSVMAMGGSAEDIALSVHGHPTLSEISKEAALDLLGRPLHRK